MFSLDLLSSASSVGYWLYVSYLMAWFLTLSRCKQSSLLSLIVNKRVVCSLCAYRWFRTYLVRSLEVLVTAGLVCALILGLVRSAYLIFRDACITNPSISMRSKVSVRKCTKFMKSVDFV